MEILILGGTSEIAKHFCKYFISEENKIYITTRQIDLLLPLKKELELLGKSKIELVKLDLLDENLDYDKILNAFINVELVLCTIGYLGDQLKATQDFQEGLKIIDINFRNLIPIFNGIANRFKSKKKGSLIVISSVAGERGRGSNYYYGSAKAGLSTYLSGLRNELNGENVHVLTVKPGFIKSKMTKDLDLPKLLTTSPEHVAKKIYEAYKRKKNVIYIYSIWRLIMIIIKLIPENVFKRMKL